MAQMMPNELSENDRLLPGCSAWRWAPPLLSLLLLGLLLASPGGNHALFLWLNGLGSHLPGWFWANLTTFGDSMAIFALGLLFVARRPLWVWALLISGLIAALMVHGLKEWFDTYRPPGVFSAEEFRLVGIGHKRVSFPSGHTTAAFSLAALLCLQAGLSRRVRWGLLALALGVGLSRIAVGVHWPVDVLGGMAIGWGATLAALWLAPRLRWGLQLGPQRLFAALLTLTALSLLLNHDSGYPQARALEMAIALVALFYAIPALLRLWHPEAEARLGLLPPPPPAPQELAELAEAKPLRQRLPGLLLRVAGTVLLFWLILRSVDLEGVRATIGAVVPRLLLLGLMFILLSATLAAFRWHLVMKTLGFDMRFGFYVRSYFKGSFFNQALPSSIGGDALRVLDVKRRGVDLSTAFYGVFIDRLLGLVGLLLLNLLAHAFTPHLLPSGVYMTINLVVLGGLGGFMLLYWLRHFPVLSRWRGVAMFVEISTRLAQVLSGWRGVGLQLVLGILVHLLAIIAMFLIGRSVGVEYGLLVFAAVVPPVHLLTMVPISLAGWGVREGAMVGLFSLLGANQAQVLTMSLLYGVVLIISSLPGFFVYMSGRVRG